MVLSCDKKYSDIDHINGNDSWNEVFIPISSNIIKLFYYLSYANTYN
jgi:hypothetical protein